MHFEKPHRHEPTEPQLATMIDVFSILIIFLIAGTAMDSSILKIPSDIVMPSTISESTTINAPQVTLFKDKMWFSLTEKEYPLDLIINPQAHVGETESIKAKIAEYKKNLESKKTGLKVAAESSAYINIVAEKSMPYSNLFLAIKFFRNSGFKSAVLVGTSQIVRKTQ